MAYLRPALFQRKVFNPLAMRFGWFGTEKLTAGSLSVPVIPVVVDGDLHVVSVRGESHWVRNARKAGSLELGGKRYTATELPVAERGPIIEAYRPKAGKSVETYWKKLPDDADHPVFALEPA